MLKMKRAQRLEYEAMQRQENRSRALSRLRSVSHAAHSALTDDTPVGFTPRRPIDMRRKPKRNKE